MYIDRQDADDLIHDIQSAFPDQETRPVRILLLLEALHEGGRCYIEPLAWEQNEQLEL